MYNLSHSTSFIFCEDGLIELGLFRLEKIRFQGELTAAFQYLKAEYKRAGKGLLQEHVVIGQGAVASN